MTTAAGAVDLKVTFLQNAAKSMAMASPSTASYLACESMALELYKGSQDKALRNDQRQTFCTACGNVFIPGWNCSIVRPDGGSVQQRSKNGTSRKIVYQCQACHYRTDSYLPQSKKRWNCVTHGTGDLRSTSLHLDTEHQTASNPTPVAMRTSSKKRARARKEKAGLRSLLQKSKEEDKASPSLNLMDLMMA